MAAPSLPPSFPPSLAPPAGQAAELVLQVLGADAGQAVVQRAAVHQAIHGGGWDLGLLPLPQVSQATVHQAAAPLLLLQEVLHDGEELFAGRHTVSCQSENRTVESRLIPFTGQSRVGQTRAWGPYAVLQSF